MLMLIEEEKTRASNRAGTTRHTEESGRLSCNRCPLPSLDRVLRMPPPRLDGTESHETARLTEIPQVPSQGSGYLATSEPGLLVS
eukprot:529071-Pleurochrysis_carterae.AAC.3